MITVTVMRLFIHVILNKTIGMNVFFRLDHGGPLRIIRGLWKCKNFSAETFEHISQQVFESIVLFVIVDYQEVTLDTMADESLALSPDNKGVILLPSFHFLFKGDKSQKVKSWVPASCRETLSDGRFYWQVDWHGLVSIGVKFKTEKVLSFARKHLHLCCSTHQYYAIHEDMFRMKSLAAGIMPKSRTVGVFLDCAGGTLSFYSILPHAPVHLHTFHTAFSEPTSPHFQLRATDVEVQSPSVIIHTLVPSSVVQTRILLLPIVMEAFPWLPLQNISDVF